MLLISNLALNLAVFLDHIPKTIWTIVDLPSPLHSKKRKWTVSYHCSEEDSSRNYNWHFFPWKPFALTKGTFAIGVVGLTVEMEIRGCRFLGSKSVPSWNVTASRMFVVRHFKTFHGVLNRYVIVSIMPSAFRRFVKRPWSDEIWSVIATSFVHRRGSWKCLTLKSLQELFDISTSQFKSRWFYGCTRQRRSSV